MERPKTGFFPKQTVDQRIHVYGMVISSSAYDFLSSRKEEKPIEWTDLHFANSEKVFYTLIVYGFFVSFIRKPYRKDPSVTDTQCIS